ncbi:MAG TPA: TonB-dependent receptor [Longimicrobium sp.]|nr:TonB-dependent receptor [Longimicrobium sp.]
MRDRTNAPDRFTPRRARRWLAAALALCATAGPARAQQSEPGGSIQGTVVDAGTMVRLRGVRVAIQPRSDTARLATVWALTDSLGRYQADELPPALYEVRAELVGYRSGTILVRVEPRTFARLSVGLQVEPIALEPIRVVAEAREHFGGRPAGAARDSVRLAAERYRQRAFLNPDAVVLTQVDVEEAVSLGDLDVLRALQRRSGVATRDDYSAELWTRGAAWDLTSVQLDGVPLFNPMHAVGAYSALSSDALGEAAFHPGIQPLQAVSGAAGLLELRTRSGFASPRAQHSADLGLVTGRAATSGQTPAGNLAWMLAARRTHVDLLAGLPFMFADVTGRLDARIGNEVRIEASGMGSTDALGGRIGNLVVIDHGRWSNRAGRVTLELAAWGGRLRTTVGGSGYRVSSAESDLPQEGCGCSERFFRAPDLESNVWYRFAESVWTVARGPAERTTFGLRATEQGARFSTSGTWPQRLPSVPVFTSSGTLHMLSLWAETRFPMTPRLELETGVRADAAQGRESLAGVRWSPRLAARYRVAPRITASAGMGRTYQYAYAVRPVGPSLEPVALAQTWWRVAGDQVPPVRSDVATLGVEYGVHRGVVGSLSAFVRDAHGLLVPEPRGGWLTGQRLYVGARQQASGAELSLRRLSGRVTGGVAYSYTASRDAVGGLRVSAATERRHVGSVHAMARLGSGLRAGGALTTATGAPITRYVHTINCHSGPCVPGIPVASESAVTRGGGYRSLDLLGNWSRPLGAGRVELDVQLRNVLGRNNRAVYRATDVSCHPERPCLSSLDGTDPRVDLTDRTLPGLPFIPFISLRVAF